MPRLRARTARGAPLLRQLQPVQPRDGLPRIGLARALLGLLRGGAAVLRLPAVSIVTAACGGLVVTGVVS